MYDEVREYINHAFKKCALILFPDSQKMADATAGDKGEDPLDRIGEYIEPSQMMFFTTFEKYTIREIRLLSL